MAITQTTAENVSSFALTWALMTTLLRKDVISKEELLTSLELSKRPGADHSAINEIIEIVKNLKLPKPS